MKKLLLISLLAFNANADLTQAEAESICEFESSAITNIFIDRYKNGVTAQDAIDKYGDNSVIMSFIGIVYKRPLVKGKEAQAKDLNKMTYDNYIQCYKRVTGGE